MTIQKPDEQKSIDELVDLYELIAVRAVDRAGTVLKDAFYAKKERMVKSKYEIVTDMDLRSQKIIVNTLKKFVPEHNILSEEAVEIDKDSLFTWIIDPLDGTHNYMDSRYSFGINIGLLMEKQFIFALSYLPFGNRLEGGREIYISKKGRGAFMNDKHVRVSDKTRLNEMTLLLNSSISRDPESASALFSILVRRLNRVRIPGSASVELCYIASGRADVMVAQYLKPYDLVGCLHVEEAGGKVTDFFGNPITTSTHSIVASNGICHDQIIEALQNEFFAPGEKRVSRLIKN
ncbi:MAG: inositol monophosphatase [Proteobacteria bacterium]|nr:inositol monophosphatase [Pseudomonadota bacterium]